MRYDIDLKKKKEGSATDEEKRNQTKVPSLKLECFEEGSYQLNTTSKKN